MKSLEKRLSKLNSIDVKNFHKIVSRLYKKMDFEISDSTIVDERNVTSLLIKNGEFGEKTRYFVHVFRKDSEITVEDLKNAFRRDIPPDVNKIVFATASTFSQEAREYAKKQGIDLKDGIAFYELLKKYGIFRSREKEKESHPPAVRGEMALKKVELDDHLERARVLVENKKYVEALKEINEVVKHEPEHLEAQMMRCEILYHLGQMNEAYEFSNILQKKYPENPKLMLLQAKILRTMGRNESALTFVEKLLSKEPLHSGALIEKGTIHKELNELEKAVECYNKAIMNEPNNWNAWYLKGITLALLGRFEESVRSFAEALLIKPDNLEILKAKRDVLLKLKEREDANNRRKFYAVFRRGINDIFDVFYTNKEHLEAKWKLYSHLDKGELSFTPHYITFFGGHYQIEIGTTFELSRVRDNINKDIIWKEVTYTDKNGEKKTAYFAEEKKFLARNRGAQKDLYSAFQNWLRLKKEESTEIRDRLNAVNKKIAEMEERERELEKERERELERLLEEEEKKRKEEKEKEKKREKKKKTKVKRCPKCKKGKILVPINPDKPLVVECDICHKKYAVKPKLSPEKD